LLGRFVTVRALNVKKFIDMEWHEYFFLMEVEEGGEGYAGWWRVKKGGGGF
jgi:hypothetical protein